MAKTDWIIYRKLSDDETVLLDNASIISLTQYLPGWMTTPGCFNVRFVAATVDDATFLYLLFGKDLFQYIEKRRKQ